MLPPCCHRAGNSLPGRWQQPARMLATACPVAGYGFAARSLPLRSGIDIRKKRPSGPDSCIFMQNAPLPSLCFALFCARLCQPKRLFADILSSGRVWLVPLLAPECICVPARRALCLEEAPAVISVKRIHSSGLWLHPLVQRCATFAAEFERN